MSKIAICITTRNRKSELSSCIFNWDKNVLCCLGTKLFIVDDASDPKYCDSDCHFEERVGIPRAKNKCLELAMDWGAEHIFLCDDDVYPLTPGCLDPYLSSPHPHLCYTFLPHTRIIDGHKHHALGNGCMMYVRREVVEKVGGFDTGFGLGKYEHVQWSHRIHASRFTPHPFIDIVGSGKLFHSMDEHAEVDRTFTPKEQAHLLNINREHYYKTRFSTKFIPYK